MNFSSERLKSGVRVLWCGTAAALVSAGLALPGLAQTAGQVTDDTFQPPARRLAGALVFTGKPGLAAPAGADRLSIELSGVTVSDTLPGTAGLVADLRRRLTGGRIAVAEIFAAAADFEAALARQGFVLARVVIPAQTLVDGGALKLTVVDGFVEAIDAAAVPAPLRRRLGELTDPLIGRRGITRDELERRLLLAGDTYGVALGSALAAGAMPGGTVVILNPQFRRITGFVGLDNSFSDSLGRVNFSAGIEANGYLGLGEVFYGRMSGHPGLGGDDGYFSERPRLRTLAAGAVFPIGDDGLTFNIEGASSRTRPDSAAGETASRFNRLSLRLYYPWVRSTRRNLSFQLSLDLQDDRQDLLTPFGDFGLYHDRTRVLRLSADGTWLFGDGGVLEAGATASLGLAGLGARTAEDAGALLPLSRDGADAGFRKLEASFRYRRAIADVWGLSVSGRAQTSFGKAMLSAEQFGIASMQDLSPFDQGALSGDSGWVIRAELSRRFEAQAFGTPLVIAPYVFGAAGEIRREHPTADEAARTGASAYGLGLELTAIRDPKFSSGSLRIEYGKGSRDDDGEDSDRLRIIGSFRF